MPSSPSRSSGSPEASPPHHIYRDQVTKAVLRLPHSSVSESSQSASSYSPPPLPLLPPLPIASSSSSRSDTGEKYVDPVTRAPLARRQPAPLRLSNEQQHFSLARSPISPTSPVSTSSTSSFTLSQTVRDPATGAPIRQPVHLNAQQGSQYGHQPPLSSPSVHNTRRHEAFSPAGTVSSMDSDELAFAATPSATAATPGVAKAPSTASSSPSAVPSVASSSSAEQDERHRGTERDLHQREHIKMPHVIPPMVPNEPFAEHHQHHPYDQGHQHHQHQPQPHGQPLHEQHYHHHASAAARTTTSHKRQHSSSLSPSSTSPTAQPGRTATSSSSSSSRHASASPASHAHSSSSAGPEKKRVRFVDDDA